MKKIVLLLIILSSLLPIYSQEIAKKITVSGKIIDASTSNPIQYATISFKKDSILVGTTSDKKGNFSLDIFPDVYTIKAKFLSYDTYTLNKKSIVETTDLGTIVLFYNSEKLDEIELTAQQQLFEFKINKKIYRSSEDVINKGSNALEVLNNTPSVTIDDNGIVRMRGTEATVLIDGKPLFGLDNGTDFLSSLPSNNIDKVELITQSAKYSAEGGGILNIITKKNKTQGLSGSIDIHGGIPEKNGGSIFLNKSSEKFNLFSTISFNNEKKIKYTDINQTHFNDSNSISSSFEENRKDKNQKNSFLFNIGSDFYLNDKNTLTTSFLINTHNKNFNSNINLDDFDSDKILNRSVKRNVNDADNILKIETLLNYTTHFNTKGQKLSFDFKYATTISDNEANIIENTITPTSQAIVQKVDKDQNLDDYLFQLDYTLPFTEEKELELGLKSTFRTYKNGYDVSQFDNNSENFVTIEGFTDIVKYNENVHAAYAQYTATHNNFSYTLGLRSEHTYVTIGTNEIDKKSKNYIDFFPSASFGYEFKNESYLSLNYSRSINRPEIYHINPFISFTDERYQSVGNPELDPYYTNYIELLYDMSFDKLFITSSIYTTYAENQFLRILKNAGQNDAGLEIFNQTTINSGNKLSSGIDVDITYTPYKGIRLNTYVSPYYEETKKAKNNNYNISNTVLYAEASVLITLFNDVKFVAQHYYQSPIIDGLAKYKSINFTNFALSTPFLKKKVILTFKVSDAFNTKNYSTHTLEASSNTNRNVSYKRQFSIALTYDFKQGDKKRKSRSKETSKDELEDKNDIKM